MSRNRLTGQASSTVLPFGLGMYLGIIAVGCARGSSGKGPAFSSSASESAESSREPPSYPPDDDGPAADLLAWRRYKSPHFVLSTNRSEGEANRILRSLEEYFSALTTVYFPAAKPSPERLPVIAVGSEVETRRYLRAKRTGAFLDPVNYQPLIVLGQDEHGFDDGVVRHELVHYAMQLSFRRVLPLWYEEGMASYFETLAYDRSNRRLLVGRATLSSVFVIREQHPLTPVLKLISGELDNAITAEPERFYATCWLLVHALIHNFPDAFVKYDRALLAGTSSPDAWAAAAPPALTGQLDQYLSTYFANKGYEAGQRVAWEAPSFEASSNALTASEALAVRAILNLVGARDQGSRQQYHNARATAHAEAALKEDPSNLSALQVELTLGRHPPIANVRRAAHRHDGSWVAWLTLFDALEGDKDARDERQDALSRAAAVAPDEGQVLIRLGYQALSRGRWQDATQLFSRAWFVAPDQPSVVQGYLEALSHHKRCGAMLASVGERADGAPLPRSEWEPLVRSVEACVSASERSTERPTERPAEHRPRAGSP